MERIHSSPLHFSAVQSRKGEITQELCTEDLLAYDRECAGDQDAYIISSNSIYMFYVLCVL